MFSVSVDACHLPEHGKELPWVLWVKGYSEVTGNEAADARAKKEVWIGK